MDISKYFEKFDNGEQVPSCEMGGMGNDFERVVQGMFIEVFREAANRLGEPVPDDEEQMKITIEDIIDEKGTEMQERFDATKTQFDLVRNMVFVMLGKGIDDAIQSVPEGRTIQISKLEDGSIDIVRPESEQ